jgi:lysine-specific demethylase 8
VSEIDVEMVNMFKYKELGKVGWTWATLKPGDCIYIPASEDHGSKALLPRHLTAFTHFS